MSYLSTYAMLEQWGRWTNTGVLPRCSSPHAAIMRDNVGTVLPAAPMISDRDAIVMDYLVARLRSRDNVLGRAVIEYFRKGSSYRHIAEKLRCDKDTAWRYVRSGVSWVDAAIAGAEDRMEAALKTRRRQKGFLTVKYT